MESSFDFIVVGAGPAGSALAIGLASSAKKPSVLLLEAGGQMMTTILGLMGSEHCANRAIDYSRGKGLGGSSAINFGCYTIGAKDDYEEWARLVGDQSFNWDNIQARFKRLETLHANLPAGVESKYTSPKSENHGGSGKLQVGYAAEWEKDVSPMLDMFEEAGFPMNPDHNSGNPIGMALSINSAHNGRRSTASDLLAPKPENLTIITDSPVQRVIFEGRRAVGIETNGKTYSASKEVILSAGALNTPRILMHSGLGPRQQLEKFGISVIEEIPAVGQGLRDRPFCALAFKRKDGDTDRPSFYGDKQAMDAALEQRHGLVQARELVASEEFKALAADVQAYLNKETVPHCEILTHLPIHWLAPNFPQDSLNYSAFAVFLYNAQVRGEATLQSADPDAALKFDPKFLSSVFDRRVAIEALREALRFTKYQGFAKDTIAPIAAPADESDEGLLDYWRQTMSSSWHMSGTAKMGKADDTEAVVNSRFKVVGVQNLRVADMSAVPILASCHVQAVAYVTGMTCADMIIEEYGLAGI
ncbi:hypothetical protein NQ176_g7880 [Zarea fungicola]|uniref:Uncharacterized protein n=1 Tax=Zarea fungicola TaxID=93591 RepID=A0ACC1MVN0_9HYPO|nr:hypothetical protein NQ176_g7880 [Lecanicillium fungicola]